MLATSKNVLFPGHKNLPATSTDDPTLIVIARAIIQVSGHQYRRLAGWLWPGNGTFLGMASMVVTWWIVAVLLHANHPKFLRPYLVNSQTLICTRFGMTRWAPDLWNSLRRKNRVAAAYLMTKRVLLIVGVVAVDAAAAVVVDVVADAVVAVVCVAYAEAETRIQ